MTTTLENYLNACQIIGEDRNIVVDGIDAIAYCGTRLTPEGRKHFAECLNLPMHEENGHPSPCVISNDDADYDEDNENSRLALAWEMLAGMAGYCSSENYDKWFKN